MLKCTEEGQIKSSRYFGEWSSENVIGGSGVLTVS